MIEALLVERDGYATKGSRTVSRVSMTSSRVWGYEAKAL
jgi:hypothetical protein